MTQLEAAKTRGEAFLAADAKLGAIPAPSRTKLKSLKNV
jgi:hypothetical protein